MIYLLLFTPDTVTALHNVVTYRSIDALGLVGVATAHQDEVVKLVGGVSIISDDLLRAMCLLHQMVDVTA